MKINIILANPNNKSFCHAIGKTCFDYLNNRRYKIHFHDLYKEHFPAVLPCKELNRTAKLPAIIKKHCDEIKNADGIIIIHPNWWGQPPAILKGWIDRIIRPGIAYEFKEGDGGEGIPKGLLRAEFALVFNTSNTPAERELRVFKDPLETLWRNCVFNLCGIKKVKRKMFNVIASSTAEKRKKWLNTVENILNHQINQS
jgi:NAD(P)H dehydrogenase (quinone)